VLACVGLVRSQQVPVGIGYKPASTPAPVFWILGREQAVPTVVMINLLRHREAAGDPAGFGVEPRRLVSLLHGL
jgi:hypothetical protein